MEVELPVNGCSVLTSPNTLYNYHHNIRTLYYIYDGKLVKSSTSTYSSLPINSVCLSQGDLVYRPEVKIHFYFMSFCLVAFAGILLFNIIIKNLWKGR